MSDLHIEQAHDRDREEVREIVRGLTGQLRDNYSMARAFKGRIKSELSRQMANHLG